MSLLLLVLLLMLLFVYGAISISADYSGWSGRMPWLGLIVGVCDASCIHVFDIVYSSTLVGILTTLSYLPPCRTVSHADRFWLALSLVSLKPSSPSWVTRSLSC